MPVIDAATALGTRALTHLRGDKVGWLTTVGAKSATPAPNPVWFVWRDETLLIFSQPKRSKLANIAANARSTFHFDDTPAGSHIVVLSGTAHVADDGVSGSDFAEFSAKYEADMRAIGFATPDQFYADYSVPVRFVPDRLRGF